MKGKDWKLEVEIEKEIHINEIHSVSFVLKPIYTHGVAVCYIVTSCPLECEDSETSMTAAARQNYKVTGFVLTSVVFETFLCLHLLWGGLWI